MSLSIRGGDAHYRLVLVDAHVAAVGAVGAFLPARGHPFVEGAAETVLTMMPARRFPVGKDQCNTAHQYRNGDI